MCGRYALGIRAAFVRHQFQNYDMPVDEAQDEDDARESYNFAPGYHGLVYRAVVPDSGARSHQNVHEQEEPSADDVNVASAAKESSGDERPKYKLQAMKWGLIPFWTKRNPEYGSMLKTINCRDDSLLENRGMWNTMKKNKRCIVIAQGFYEWLKKNGGKEKVPHYMKRPDDRLMCFAGLWDCVQYEGSDEKHYTYTIITTDSNDQLKFLHDRMPVIFENGSEDMFKWLDPNRTEWSKELQSLLKPYKGQLECYPVMKEVGKVGNNSPDFIVPVASSDNKQNIANFFANAKSPGKPKNVNEAKSKVKDSEKTKPESEKGSDLENEAKLETQSEPIKLEKNEDDRKTIDVPRTEDNAPVPAPPKTAGTKREHDEEVKTEEKTTTSKESPPKKKLRSSTSNGSSAKVSPQKGANHRITSFFGK